MYKLVVSDQLIVFGSEKLTTILFVGKMPHLNFPVKLVMITGRVVDLYFGLSAGGSAHLFQRLNQHLVKLVKVSSLR